nr:MAG TPA: Cytosine specific methyltransferase [Caudoviricetes sp.]
MNSKLTLGSLFDGSGGFPLGGLISGIIPLWSSEIEPFCIRVTSKRLPQVKHYGNVSDIDGGEIEPVDIITFGSPCQDMSVAGKRSGLDGERSCLFYEAVRIIKEMRCKTNGKYPRFVVWENVPGAFSSNKGEDFKAVLEAICKIKSETFDVPKPEKWSNSGCIVADDFSLAWRVLDAQYWGVPQRRKRIYLVADFADECAGKILFESESLSGYSEKSLCSWQGTANNLEKGIGAAGISIDGYNSAVSEKASTLGVNCGMSTGRNGVLVLNDQGGNRMDVTEDKTCTLRAESHHPPLVFENHSQDSRYTGPNDVSQTVSSTFGMGGNNQPFVVETPKTLKVRCGCEGGGKGALIQDDKSATLSCNNEQAVFVPKCFGICSKDSNSMKSANPYSGFYEADTTRTIDSSGGNPSCNQGGMAVVCVDQGGGKSSCNVTEELSPTLTCTHGGEPVVAIEGNGTRPSHNGDGYKETNVMYTLNATEQHAVAVPTYSMTTGCFMQVNEDKAPTIAARDYKDAPLVGFSQERFDDYAENDCSACVKASGGNYGGGSETLVIDETSYIVRRLTPTECARLQGFPDWWCDSLETENPTDAEIQKWKEIFDNYNKAIGKSTKPKTDKQIIKWLKNPHSDSAEYKMWGNGVALPCVCFVLSGIVYYSQLTT